MSTASGDFAVGQHVRVTFGIFQGKQGTIVRPSRWVFPHRGWLVEFDERPSGLLGRRRTTFVPRALEHDA